MFLLIFTEISINLHLAFSVLFCTRKPNSVEEECQGERMRRKEFEKLAGWEHRYFNI